MFSMLDRIESMMSAPKRYSEGTKLWERALDEDLKRRERKRKEEALLKAEQESKSLKPG